MYGKRFFGALLTAILLIVACLPFGTAFAAEKAFDETNILTSLVVVANREAKASFAVNNLPINDTAGNEVYSGSHVISIDLIRPVDANSGVTIDFSQFTPITVAAKSVAGGAVPLMFSSTFRYPSTIYLNFYYSVDGKAESKPLTVQFSVDKESAGQNEGEKLSALVLDSTDLTGAVIPAPSGNAGDTIKIRLPVKNRGNGIVTGAEIMPQLSQNLDEFPFEITELEYKRGLPGLAPGGKAVIEYQFKLSKSVTSGIKPVTFNAVYYVDGVAQTTQFKVYVTVVKGAAAPTDPNGKPIPTSVPKVIIKSYTLEPQQLMAGEEFKLTMELLNTSASEAVKNLKITVKNDDGVILPASSGSNTLYVSKINKESTVTAQINLQSAPDIAAKAHILSVTFSYEGGTTLTSYDAVETLSLPISQPIRLKLGEPVMYGGAMLEQPASVSFSLYNMGKSTVYNMMVTVEGDGLRMEEPYYGSNVTSGSNMTADFNIIPSAAGTIDANVVVTYEDVYGKQYTEKAPFQVTVMENAMPEVTDPGMEGMNPEPPQSGPSLLLILGIVAGVLIVGIVVLLQVRKSRRRRQLEED